MLNTIPRNLKYTMIFLILIIVVDVGAVLTTRIFMLTIEAINSDEKNMLSIHLDMSEHDVESIMGKYDVAYNSETDPGKYHNNKNCHNKRDATNKVHIYMKGQRIAYIYYDRFNKVEYVHLCNNNIVR